MLIWSMNLQQYQSFSETIYSLHRSSGWIANLPFARLLKLAMIHHNQATLRR
jgi:hypothetical protein